MVRDYLTTSQIARAAGVHPNTVRLYEAWGFIPQAEQAAHLVEVWAQSSSTSESPGRLQIGQVAWLLDVSRDQGRREHLPQALDSPRPDENPVMAADRWLTTLAEEERRAVQLIKQLADILEKQSKP